MVTVLVPHAIAERCYLREALLWVAVHRAPLGYITENGVDGREDAEYVENDEPYLPEVDVVTTEESEAAGLKPNPEWEQIEAYASPEFLEDFIKRLTDDQLRAEAQEELSKSIALRERQLDWDREFDGFIDQYRIALFQALHEGRLPAFGKRLPRPSTAESVGNLALDWWASTPWERIESSFWISFKIDWAKSRAEGRGGACAFILVPTSDLFEAFPFPTPGDDGLVKIGDRWALLNRSASIVTPSRQLGRPPFKWDEFYLEVCRRVKEGSLPDKQEAFISEMGAWCRSQWNRSVGRSTILENVKPYYDAFARPKQSEK